MSPAGPRWRDEGWEDDGEFSVLTSAQFNLRLMLESEVGTSQNPQTGPSTFILQPSFSLLFTQMTPGCDLGYTHIHLLTLKLSLSLSLSLAASLSLSLVPVVVSMPLKLKNIPPRLCSVHFVTMVIAM